jgi:hypothetical protein
MFQNSLSNQGMEFHFILNLISSAFSHLPTNNSRRIYRWCYHFFVDVQENTFPDDFLESLDINFDDSLIQNDYNIFNGFIAKMVERNGFRFQLQLNNIIQETDQEFDTRITNRYVVGQGIMDDHKLSYIFYSVMQNYTERCIENIRHTDNLNIEPILYNLKQNIISLKNRIIEGLIISSNLNHHNLSSSAVPLGRRNRRK